MLRTHRIGIVAMALVFSASAQTDSAVEQGLKLLEAGRTSLVEQQLTKARDYFVQLAQQRPGNSTLLFEQARANQYLCESFSARGDKKNAERALDAAISNVQQALKLDEKSADAHSLLADLYGRKIGFGIGMFAGPKYGPKVKAENQRAMELEAKNPRVFASLGRQYLEAPKMFGGDLDQAIESFRKSLALDAQSDETYVWLALALRKKGDADGADKALQEALHLNPQSAFALEAAKKNK
jgi:tetratricopeptide (TPR) repeat protein